jgi:hypothetical protein
VANQGEWEGAIGAASETMQHGERAGGGVQAEYAADAIGAAEFGGAI